MHIFFGNSNTDPLIKIFFHLYNFNVFPEILFKVIFICKKLTEIRFFKVIEKVTYILVWYEL